jgi:hypothetical protein
MFTIVDYPHAIGKQGHCKTFDVSMGVYRPVI